jgi:hypothetical protein
MSILIVRGLIVFAALLFAGSLHFGFQATVSSIGPAKGLFRYRSTACVGIGICLCAVSMAVDKSSHKLYDFSGTLLSQNIIHNSSRHFSSYLEIQTVQGGQILVHLSDRVPLAVGQWLWVQYESDSGEIRRIRYYSNSNKRLGKWSSLWPFQTCIMFLFGLFFIWGAHYRFNRDPEGQFEPLDRDSNSTATVDEASLLHLSDLDA